MSDKALDSDLENFPAWPLDNQVLKDEYLAAVRRDYPHNFRVFILFDLIWGLGIPFGSTLAPAFMVVLGSSKSLIGLVTSLPMIAGLVQIVISHYFRHLAKKKWLSFSYFASLLPWMMFNLFFFLNLQEGSSDLKLMLFCLVQTVFWFTSAGNEGIRFSMLTECTPLTKRGALFGGRSVIQVLVSLAVWPLAVWVLKQWPEPANYLASFIIACAFYMVSSFSYLLTREHRDPEIDNGERTQGFAVIVKDSCNLLSIILRDRTYRVFLVYSVVLYCATAMGPFIIVYAKEKMNLSGSQIIHFTILQMSGGALMTQVLGKLADRIGYKRVGWLLTVPLASGFLLAAFYADASEVHHAALYASFFLCASMIPVSRMVAMNLAIELMPLQNIGMLISLTNALISPVMLGIAALGGWIVDLTGTYVFLFLSGAVLASAAGLGFALFVTEPRKASSLPGELVPVR